MRKKIEEKNISIIYEIKNDLNGMEIDGETDLFKELQFDSIEIMTFISELEHTFRIIFEDIDELMEGMSNVKSVADFVYDHMQTVRNE